MAKQRIEAAAADAARSAAQVAGLLPGGPAGQGGNDEVCPADALLYGPDDPEHPDARQGLQAALAAAAAQPRLERVQASLHEQGDWEGLALLADLRHATADHGWLWEMSGAAGASLKPAEFVDAVLLRLGGAPDG